jgi:prepilin-type N-terminal cleavage/methylation domain-containing protein
MKGNKKITKGFTLIELLVVIAIIAILSVVVILTLNPAELLRESRDSNRISDLSVTKSAISFYLASVTTPILGTSATCYMDAAGSTSASSSNSYATTTCATWFPYAPTLTGYSSSTAVGGSGWIPINLTTTTAAQYLAAGSPLGAWPHDPSNNNGWNFYSYEASSSPTYQFKLDAHMESAKYGYTDPSDVVSTDGGVDPQSYEQGTNLQM